MFERLYFQDKTFTCAFYYNPYTTIYKLILNIYYMCFSDWESKGPCAIVPLTWKMAHQSLCRMIRNGPLKISKSLKKGANGPLAQYLFPITGVSILW